MIFVTVGTHEQPFRRLVEYMDNWASEHDEEVLIQAGYTDYRAKYAKIKKFLPREEMAKCISQARIVITHGGPACYSEVLRAGKVPVVVPRSKKFGEQYDDHQIEIGREFKLAGRSSSRSDSWLRSQYCRSLIVLETSILGLEGWQCVTLLNRVALGSNRQWSLRNSQLTIHKSHIVIGNASL